MTAPANTKIASFEQRLTRVQAEVTRRTANMSQHNQVALRARLWVKWLMMEVA